MSANQHQSPCKVNIKSRNMQEKRNKNCTKKTKENLVMCDLFFNFADSKTIILPSN